MPSESTLREEVDELLAAAHKTTMTGRAAAAHEASGTSVVYVDGSDPNAVGDALSFVLLELKTLENIVARLADELDRHRSL